MRQIAILLILMISATWAWPGSLALDQLVPQAEAAGENMIILWDGAVVPVGWTCISCTSGDDFFQRFIRGAAAYGGTGGAADHLHTAAATINAATDANGENKAGTVVDDLTHSHSGSVTATPATNLPAYRQLKVIQHVLDGNPPVLPAGAILIFDAAVPSGFTRYSAQDGSYIYGEGTAAITGGANTHTVSVSGTVGASTGGATVAARGGGTQITAAAPAHTHTFSGASAADNHEPPFLEVILGKLDSATTTIASGTIAMWDATPGSDWTVVSGSGGDFNQVFIKPAASYGTTGGSATHNHADFSLTSSGPTGTTNARSGATAASDVHTHGVDITGVSSENHLPPYRDVIFAQNNGATPPSNTLPTTSSVSIDSGASAVNLTEGTTKTISCVGTVTDDDGFADISSVTADLYRTSLGSTSALSNDNHYRLSGDTNCIPSGGSGSSETYTCDFEVQYFAQATDAGSTNAGDDWTCSMVASDAIGEGAFSTDTIEMNSLLALAITAGDPIDYGNVDPNTDTGSTNQLVTVQNTGNVAMDPELSGVDMTNGGDTIAVAQQEYDPAAFTYGAGTALSGTPTGVNLNLPGPTTGTIPVTDSVRWGIGVPNSTAPGTYTGTTTFAAAAAI